jgi:hypothetical protein
MLNKLNARLATAAALVALIAAPAAQAGGARSLADLCGRTVVGALTIEGGEPITIAGDCPVTLAPGAGFLLTDAAPVLDGTLSFHLGKRATLRLERVLLTAKTIEVTGDGGVVVFHDCSLALDEVPWIEAEAWDFRGGRMFRRVDVR